MNVDEIGIKWGTRKEFLEVECFCGEKIHRLPFFEKEGRLVVEEPDEVECSCGMMILAEFDNDMNIEFICAKDGVEDVCKTNHVIEFECQLPSPPDEKIRISHEQAQISHE